MYSASPAFIFIYIYIYINICIYIYMYTDTCPSAMWAVPTTALDYD